MTAVSNDGDTALDDARWQRGIAVVEKMYGPAMAKMMDQGERTVTRWETVGHQFGEIMARPGLSIRDRRLIILGAVTMLGRTELLAVQAEGALWSGDLTEEELEEIALLMMFYAGMPNVTAFKQAVAKAKAALAEKSTG